MNAIDFLIGVTFPARTGQPVRVEHTTAVTLRHGWLWNRSHYRLVTIRDGRMDLSKFETYPSDNGRVFVLAPNTVIVELHGSTVTIYAPPVGQYAGKEIHKWTWDHFTR